MTKSNLKKVRSIIGDIEKCLEFVKTKIDVSPVMNYPVLQIYSSMNVAKAHIEQIQELLSHDKECKLKEMGYSH